MTDANELLRCASCGSDRLREILYWPSIPVSASRFPRTLDDSLSIPRASFRLVACEACGLLFNADHDESLVEYSPECIETQAVSTRHRAFTDRLARDWIDRHDLRGAQVVEVGCGYDAGFLRLLGEIDDVTGTGIDPAVDPSLSVPGLTLLPERFEEAHARIPGRALVCRHTLEHIPRVGAFLRTVRAWATANGDAPVLFEVPDSGRILAEGAFWDVYYEHCSYFTAATLASSFKAHGLEPDRVELVYDGQYLVLDGHPGEPVPPQQGGGAAAVDAAEAFARSITARIARAGTALRALRADGPLVIWQAGGKALALVTLSGTEDAVSALVDTNPEKRGRYLPGTKHAIRGSQDVAQIGPAHVVVMNDVYVPEIASTLSGLGVEADVLSVDTLLR